jgi:hypothetical protein
LRERVRKMRIKLSELKRLIREEANKSQEKKLEPVVEEVFSLAQKAHESGVTGALRILLKIQNLLNKELPRT